MERSEIPPGNDQLAASMVVGAIIQLIDTKVSEERRKAVGPIQGNLIDYADEVAACCARLLGATPIVDVSAAHMAGPSNATTAQ